MANRIVGNVYILDTGSANTQLPWPRDAKVASIAFWGATTSSVMTIAAGDTGNVLLTLNGPSTVGAGGTTNVHFGGVYFADSLTLPVLTAGTGWIYFC